MSRGIFDKRQARKIILPHLHDISPVKYIAFPFISAPHV